MTKLNVTSMVRSKTGEPAVSIYMPGEHCQMSADEADAFAANIRAGAAAARVDAFLVAYCRDHLFSKLEDKTRDENIGMLIADFRQWRENQ